MTYISLSPLSHRHAYPHCADRHQARHKYFTTFHNTSRGIYPLSFYHYIEISTQKRRLLPSAYHARTLAIFSISPRHGHLPPSKHATLLNTKAVSTFPFTTSPHARGGSNSIAKYCNTFEILQYLLQYFNILQ